MNRLFYIMILFGVLVACQAQAPQEETGPGAAIANVGVDELIVEATIEQIQTAVLSGAVSCEQVVEAYLRRIEAYDDPIGLNAITHVNARAVDRARAIDERVVRGEVVGPLFCVPVLAKDNFDTSDMPTSGGSVTLAGRLPFNDATMIERLRRADAIILAKTNMAEWAFSPRQSISSSFGQTANAYDLERTPAGSSGGTASGVAASFAAAGLGTDTGNSIRGPSSHLALFGIRSTIGLTTRDGVVPLVFDRDIAGPMARNVTDGARLFNILAGSDPKDPYTAEADAKRERDYTAFLKADGLRGMRIGVLRALVETEEADPAVVQIFEEALASLERAGAVVVDPFDVPELAGHLANDDGNFCPRFRYDLAQYATSRGISLDIADILAAGDYGERDPLVKGGLEFFSGFPIDASPAEWETPCPDYADHPGRQSFKRDVVAAMDRSQVDVIIYPSWTVPPAAIDRADEDYAGDNSQLIAPATGLPAASVPMGYVDGLPAGLQILARAYGEGVIFQAAYGFEQATQHRRPPALFPVLED